MIETVREMSCDICGRKGDRILESEDAETLMRMSREEGWVITDSGDFCPECYKSGNVANDERFANSKLIMI